MTYQVVETINRETRIETIGSKDYCLGFLDSMMLYLRSEFDVLHETAYIKQLVSRVTGVKVVLSLEPHSSNV